MTFDSDDPLGDLLSQGSGDSFFEEPKVLAKRASLKKAPDKKSISDLFGLDDKKPKDKLQNKEDDWLGIGSASEEKGKPTENLKSALSNPDRPVNQPTKPTKKISFEDDDDDVLNTLGLEKAAEPAAEGSKEKELDSRSKKIETSKKSALMESIFGPPKQQGEEFSSFEDILRDSKAGRQKTHRSPTPPAQTTEAAARSTPQQSVGYALTDLPREGRRPRHQSAGSGISDPLGLFSSESVAKAPAALVSKEPEQSSSMTVLSKNSEMNIEPSFTVKHKDLKTKSAPDISRGLPDWLGQGSPVRNYKSETVIAKSAKTDEIRRSSTSHEDADIQDASPKMADVVDSATSITDNPMLESLVVQQKFATSHLGYQNTSTALQQQESQLLMALQLKKYEENLAEMQRKQQGVLIKQEQQFNSLLERQFMKQQVMENNMRMQQERINNHIQLLISQTPFAGKTDNEESEDLSQLKKVNAEENCKLYEEMIATLKQRQHEEIFLLNESYKKQISLLENSMEAVENRLKTEFTSLSEQFRGTIDHLKTEHEAEVDKYKQKLQEMSSVHVNEIKLIRENHNRIIEEIKYEYSTMIENMKQLKQTENSTLESASTYTQKLDNSLEVLEVNSKILNEIRGKVQHDYGVLTLAREETLKAKEDEIKLMRITLEKSREAAETERAQLMGLVQSLEMKLVEQNQNAREERWALQQAAAVLTARSAAFDREMEFTRASLEREREQIKTLKENILAEQEKVMLQLTEEKLTLSAEKSRLETTAKLNQNYDAQKARVEIDAAVQAAKEATELTDRERENLQRQQSEVESLKRNLLDRERKLALKENELQEMFASADRKAQAGERALAEAKVLEAKYNARLRDIQSQLVSLTSREKKLAEEKIMLSKERLTFHSSLRQSKKCSLCAATESIKPEENTFAVDMVEQDFSPRIFAVTDPDILRLRYEIGEERTLIPKEFDDSSVNK